MTSSQRERWGRMRVLEDLRRELYEELKSEWKANDDGELATSQIADLENESAENLKTPEPEWEEYLTENGKQLFAKLCEVDEQLASLNREEEDASVREAAEAYYHH